MLFPFEFAWGFALWRFGQKDFSALFQVHFGFVRCSFFALLFLSFILLCYQGLVFLWTFFDICYFLAFFTSFRSTFCQFSLPFLWVFFFFFFPLYLNSRWKECYCVTIWSVIQFNYGFRHPIGTNFLLKSDLRNFQMGMISVDVFHTLCAFELEWKMKIISLFRLFLLLFMSLNILFDTIYWSYCIILTNFYLYLQ